MASVSMSSGRTMSCSMRRIDRSPRMGDVATMSGQEIVHTGDPCPRSMSRSHRCPVARSAGDQYLCPMSAMDAEHTATATTEHHDTIDQSRIAVGIMTGTSLDTWMPRLHVHGHGLDMTTEQIGFISLHSMNSVIRYAPLP